jgi:hypothetical protein
MEKVDMEVPMLEADETLVIRSAVPHEAEGVIQSDIINRRSTDKSSDAAHGQPR